MIYRYLSSIFLLCVIAPLAYGDGGTLRFYSEEDEAAYLSPWPIENASHINKQLVDMRELGEEGYLLEPSAAGSKSLFVTSSGDVLYSDANRDGKFSPDERFEGTGSRKNIFSPKTYSFLFPMPLRVGGLDRTVRAALDVRVRNGRAYYTFTEIRSGYRGEIQIGGETYPARLFFRTPQSDDSQVNEIVILDSNGDGEFDSFRDAWFSAMGIANFKDSLWTVRTFFSGEESNVSLQPYTGKTGRLSIRGESLHRIYLQGAIQEDYPNHEYYFYPICLPANEKQTFTLPSGQFKMLRTWLKSSGREDLYYQCKQTDILLTRLDDASSVTIGENSEETLPLGGPLKLRMKVRSSYVLGSANLNFEGLRNSAGYPYEPMGLHEIQQGVIRSLPTLEIKNERGAVVATGSPRPG